jgi:hypothetical protein
MRDKEEREEERDDPKGSAVAYIYWIDYIYTYIEYY